jgi:hypothetical protein
VLTEEQLAQAIAGLDSKALDRLARLLPKATARSILGDIARLHPPRRRTGDFERVLEAVTQAGETGITLGELTRKLRLPAASLRKELEHLIGCGIIHDEPDERIGRGRPAVRFRATSQQR